MTIISILCVLSFLYSFLLRQEIASGKLAMGQLRVIRNGSVYKIDQLEGLGRSKYFFSFKEDD